MRSLLVAIALMLIAAPVLAAPDFRDGGTVEAVRVIDAPGSKIAALVSIAGIVGGIWAPDDLRLLMQPGEPWIAASCPGDVQDGVGSLSRDVRQSVLRGMHVDIPSYSLVAASDAASTSTVLEPGWR